MVGSQHRHEQGYNAADELDAAIEKAFKEDGQVLVEEMIQRKRIYRRRFQNKRKYHCTALSQK